MPPFDAHQAGQRLLDWNRRHLTASATLEEAHIAELFAAEFTVKANGRTHPATPRLYREFLDGFRRDIASIDYQVQQSLAEQDRVVLVLDARVTRLDGRVETFAAMLLLAFDAHGLIRLWQEVYVRT